MQWKDRALLWLDSCTTRCFEISTTRLLSSNIMASSRWYCFVYHLSPARMSEKLLGMLYFQPLGTTGTEPRKPRFFFAFAALGPTSRSEMCTTDMTWFAKKLAFTFSMGARIYMNIFIYIYNIYMNINVQYVLASTELTWNQFSADSWWLYEVVLWWICYSVAPFKQIEIDVLGQPFFWWPDMTELP